MLAEVATYVPVLTPFVCQVTRRGACSEVFFSGNSGQHHQAITCLQRGASSAPYRTGDVELSIVAVGTEAFPRELPGGRSRSLLLYMRRIVVLGFMEVTASTAVGVIYHLSFYASLTQSASLPSPLRPRTGATSERARSDGERYLATTGRCWPPNRRRGRRGGDGGGHLNRHRKSKTIEHE